MEQLVQAVRESTVETVGSFLKTTKFFFEQLAKGKLSSARYDILSKRRDHHTLMVCFIILLYLVLMKRKLFNGT